MVLGLVLVIRTLDVGLGFRSRILKTIYNLLSLYDVKSPATTKPMHIIDPRCLCNENSDDEPLPRRKRCRHIKPAC